MALPAVLAAAAGALLPVVGDVMNMKNVDRTNDTNKSIQDTVNNQNMDIFNQQMDYTKSVQQQTWNREDTAYQRAAEDARRAGFSPLVASGISAGGAGSPVSQPAAPSMQATRMQAPQMSDLNGLTMLADMAIKQRELDIADRGLDIQESRIDKELGERKASRLQENKHFNRNLENINNQLTQRLTQEKSLANKSRIQDLLKFNQTLALQTKAQTHVEKVKSQELIIQQASHLMERAKGATGGKSSNYRAYDNWDEYVVAKRQWDHAYEQAIQVFLAEPTSSSSSSSRGGSGSLSVAGTGLGLGANVAGSSSRNISNKQEAYMTRFFATNPIPLYYPGMRRSK